MQIHGVQVDRVKGRFAGTIDEVDDDIFRHDRYVIMLVAARTAAGATDTMDDGEVVQTMRLKVQDMVPLTGELRDQAVAFMAHGGNQGVMSFGNHIEKPKEEQRGQQTMADYAQPPEPTIQETEQTYAADDHSNVDPSTGEVVSVSDEDEFFDVPVAEPDPVVPRPTDVEPPQWRAPEAEPISDPNPARDVAPPPPGNVVGHVTGGRPRRDSVLDDFLNS